MELYKYLIANNSEILILALQLFIGIGFVFIVSIIMHSKKNNVPIEGNNEMFVLLSFIQSNLNVDLSEGLDITKKNENKRESDTRSLVLTTLELFFLAPLLGYRWLNLAKKVNSSKFRHPLERAQILMQALGIVLANVILAIIVTVLAVYSFGDACHSKELHSEKIKKEEKQCLARYNLESKESTQSKSGVSRVTIELSSYNPGVTKKESSSYVKVDDINEVSDQLSTRFSLNSFLKNSDFWLIFGYGFCILYFSLSFLAALLAIVLLVKRQVEWKEFWTGELGKIFRKSVVNDNHDLYNQCHNLSQSIQSQPVIPLSQMHQVIVLVVGFTQIGIPIVVPYVISTINNLLINA